MTDAVETIGTALILPREGPVFKAITGCGMGTASPEITKEQLAVTEQVHVLESLFVDIVAYGAADPLTTTTNRA